jgi:tetratricopeptide (TPR) repeat protein
MSDDRATREEFPASVIADRAMMLFRQKRYDLALADFRLLVSQNTSDVWSKGMIGMCLSRLGEVQDAYQSIERNVADHPDSSLSHYFRSLFDQERGWIREAHEAAIVAVSIEPRDAILLSNLGETELRREQFESALSAAEAALLIDPINLIAMRLRCRALTALGRSDEAAAVASEVLRLAPNDADSHAIAGTAAVRKSPAEGLAHLHEAIRLNPEDRFAFALKRVGAILDGRDPDARPRRSPDSRSVAVLIVLILVAILLLIFDRASGN